MREARKSADFSIGSLRAKYAAALELSEEQNMSIKFSDAAHSGAARAKAGETGMQVFSTCPSSLDAPDRYLERIVQVARWSEWAGCAGMLVYTDNSVADPWLVSQILIQNTRSLCPLVAVQPVYMHPYSVAKMVSTLAYLHGRQIYLNMVAGGFKNDLAALDDTTPHDRRYERLVEYTQLIQQLLQGGTVSMQGEFYRVTGLTLNPRMARDLYPGFLMSGSSDAGLAAARTTGSIAVKYPEPPGSETAPDNGPSGVRIGIVARARSGEAWDAAAARFPEDRQGQLTRQFANKVSDSAWHARLSEVGKERRGNRQTYWLRPFENYQTNCPYLVGSYEEVAGELARYLGLGHRAFILDTPAAEEEFEHIAKVFESATRRKAS
jgi:alkanesulfonate monooxygenase